MRRNRGGPFRQYNGRIYDPATGFHDYGARLYWPEIGRFISADTYGGEPSNPASLNRYSYVHNNPYKYVDPTGNAVAPPAVQHAIQADKTNFANAVATMGSPDASFLEKMVAAGKATLAAINLITGEGFIPGTAVIAAPGAASQGAAATGAALARQLGKEGEAAVRGAANIGEKTAIKIGERVRVPDGLTAEVLSEVKNVKAQSFTRQLRDYADFAKQTEREFDLYVRSGTELSGPLLQAADSGVVNICKIPGS